MRSFPRLVTISALGLAVGFAYAQKLPPPTRIVYKCLEKEKVVYSDAPCLGATKVDIEPTRGMNASTGRERIGKDVSHEHQREAMAEALRPLTGLDAKQLDRNGRRMKLPPETQRRCRILDTDIPHAEHAERNASHNEIAIKQQDLFRLRSEFRSAQCE